MISQNQKQLPVNQPQKEASHAHDADGDLSSLRAPKPRPWSFIYSWIAGVIGVLAAGGAPQVAAQERAAEQKPMLSRWTVVAWRAEALYDNEGYAFDESKWRSPMALTDGDALGAIISGTRDYKKAVGGNFPPKNVLKLVTVINGRDTRRAYMPIEKIPSQVTPNSLRAFGLDKGCDSALQNLTRKDFSVLLAPIPPEPNSDRRQVELRFFMGELPDAFRGNPFLEREENRTRNCFYLQLYPDDLPRK